MLASAVCNYFQHYKLGAPIPNSPHAVCTSLPTLEDIVGYEEKTAATMAHITQGYPRFVRHHWIIEAAQVLATQAGLTGRLVYPVASEQAAQEMLRYVGGYGAITQTNDWWLTHFPQEDELGKRAHLFLQHTGVSMSSREAEQILLAHGTLPVPHKETLFEGDWLPYTKAELTDAYHAHSADDIFLSRSGMCAFYRVVQHLCQQQQPHNRRVWLLLGWLYIDTQRILEKLLPEGFSCIKQLDVSDTQAIDKIFKEHGHELAGVITEVPTNPLMHTADIPALAKRCREAGAACILDPSTVSPLNVNLLPHADVVTSSLTKYTGHTGDVMAGIAVLNHNSPWRDTLAAYLSTQLEAPSEADARRLAHALGNWREVTRKINSNARQLVSFLEKHPNVQAVHWAGDARSAEHYAAIATTEGGCGSLISIELKIPLKDFYDRASIVKGPSFGTSFTFMCPFIMLAHYELASTQEGQKFLRTHGIDPHLLRISCGAEDYPLIEQAFADALAPHA